MKCSARHEQYGKNAVEGASQLQLIVMLYDAAIRFLRQAKGSMVAGDLPDGCEALLKGKAIVAHLLGSLRDKEGGEVAALLRRLYLFCYEEITEINLAKDPSRVDGVVKVLSSLRSAWHELALHPPVSPPTPADSAGEDPDSIYLSVST